MPEHLAVAVLGRVRQAGAGAAPALPRAHLLEPLRQHPVVLARQVEPPPPNRAERGEEEELAHKGLQLLPLRRRQLRLQRRRVLQVHHARREPRTGFGFSVSV